jgi:non-ribosomal peptide synthetase component F
LYEHGVDVIASIFGVLKAGKFYVVLDASFPREKITYILDDSEARLVVTNNRHLVLACALANDARAVLNIDESEDVFSSDDPGVSVSPADKTNITYTSGSTGTPQGVVETHRYRLHDNMIHTNELRFSAEDRFSLHSVGFASAHIQLMRALAGQGVLLGRGNKHE